jgi:hypothetical protein
MLTTWISPCDLQAKTGKGSLCETSLIRAATWNMVRDVAHSAAAAAAAAAVTLY